MLGEMTLAEAAKEAAGNWREFECFCWFRQNELEEPDDWSIIYHSHRDSGLLDQSNAAAVEKEMEKFTDGDDPDVVMESHHHWAVGHIDGFSVRVYRDGQITEAFKTYHKLAVAMDNYPVLDEEDYSNREYEATYENIADAAWRLKNEYELPEDWQSEVHYWLGNHTNALENVDDQGGYPSEDELRAAFEALGYKELATA